MVKITVPWEDAEPEVIIIGSNQVPDKTIVDVLVHCDNKGINPEPFDVFYDDFDNVLPGYEWLQTSFGHLLAKLNSNILREFTPELLKFEIVKD